MYDAQRCRDIYRVKINLRFIDLVAVNVPYSFKSEHLASQLSSISLFSVRSSLCCYATYRLIARIFTGLPKALNCFRFRFSPAEWEWVRPLDALHFFRIIVFISRYKYLVTLIVLPMALSNRNEYTRVYKRGSKAAKVLR